MIYVPRHFEAYELLPRDFYYANEKRGIQLFLVFDRNLLIVMDALRDELGMMTCNDWYWGGENQYRGWRPMDCMFGSDLSQHKFGRAADLLPREVTPEEARSHIRLLQSKYPFSLISAVEEGVNWLHVDTRNRDPKSGILFFNP